MKTNITQRLIAAGASPERARAFETQFKTQTSAFGIKKPQDIQDAFDAELAAFSEAKYPKVFRPPKLDDPRIDSYIQALYGEGKLGELENKAFATEAPNFSRVLQSSQRKADTTTYNLDEYIVNKIVDGVPYSQIVNDLISVEPIELIGSLTEGKVGDIVSKYYNEFNSATTKLPKYKENLLMTDKYYKVGLPDPNLVYDKKENLAEGKIAWTTHPSVKKIIEAGNVKVKEQLAQTYGPAGPQSSAAAGIAALPDKEIENLFVEFKASGATPFKDEVKRRESLKKQTTIKPRP